MRFRAVARVASETGLMRGPALASPQHPLSDHHHTRGIFY